MRAVAIFGAGLLFRFLPFRPPNVELILASAMPIAKVYGKTAGFLFGALSILVFDLLTGTLGPWSLVTAPAYGVLGLIAGWFLRNRSGRRHYVYFAIVGTLFYDAITGLTIGPLFFGQPFLLALYGQIPFTLMHLLGNTSFAFLLSPLIERSLVAESQSRLGACVLPKIPNHNIQIPNKAQNPKITNDTIQVCPSV